MKNQRTEINPEWINQQRIYRIEFLFRESAIGMVPDTATSDDPFALNNLIQAERILKSLQERKRLYQNREYSSSN